MNARNGYKVTLTRRLACGDVIGLHHLAGCSREVAGDAARTFAAHAEAGDVLTISKVETAKVEVKRKTGKSEAAPETRDEVRETVCAQATCLTGETWRADVGGIDGVSVPSRLEDGTRAGDILAVHNAKVTASSASPTSLTAFDLLQ